MDVGAALKDSWELLKKWPLPIVLGTLIMTVISNFAGGLLAGHFMGGVAILASKGFAGQEPELGDVFKSFEKFVDYLLVGIVMMLGLLACFVGVFVTSTLFIFAPVIIAETGADWKTALTQSKQLVMANLGDVIMLILAGVGINILGALLCGIGMLITMPLYLLSISRCYQQLTGTAGGAMAPAAPAPA